MIRFIAIFIVSFFSVDNIAIASVVKGSAGSLIKARVVANFVEPWSMTFISKNELLVTSKLGRLWRVSVEGAKKEVSGVPQVVVAGQGGLGDVIRHPNFIENKLIYLSFINADQENSLLKGAVVIRAKFNDYDFPYLTNKERIWEQVPKMPGSGHYSHRMAFGPQGSEHEGRLFITSGDRQFGIAAQDMESSLGKIIRINSDGTYPLDNPFQSEGSLAKSFWSVGHRNALGLAFDKNGKLWSHEMGPRHGDELNLIQGGNNYGWPLVSEGSHYDGRAIPSHASIPAFAKPVKSWVPTVAPSGMIFYSGLKFPEWEGDAFIGGLKSRALIRLGFTETTAFELERFQWGSRIREVELAPDGSIWVLEDPPMGRLIQFVPF